MQITYATKSGQFVKVHMSASGAMARLATLDKGSTDYVLAEDYAREARAIRRALSVRAANVFAFIDAQSDLSELIKVRCDESR